MKDDLRTFLSLYLLKGALQAKIAWFDCIDRDMRSGAQHILLKQIASISKQIKLLNTSLEFFLTNEQLDWLSSKAKSLTLKEKERIESLIEVKTRPHELTFNKKAFINKTDLIVPEDVQILLSFGWKFLSQFNTHNDNLHWVLAQIEKCIDDTIPPLLQHEAYKEITPLLNDYNSVEHNPTKQWINFITYRAKCFFRKNKQVFATRSDKGSHTVLIEQDTYEDFIHNMLDNKSYQSIGPYDENTVRCTLSPLVTKEFFLLRYYEDNPYTSYLVPKGYQPNTCDISKFYGLPKVHKETFALRPIVSMTNAPGHALGTLFNGVLNQVFPRSDYHIQDSYSMKKFIDSTRININSQLVSFDVVSMYTNIPRDLTKNIIMKNHDKFYELFRIKREVLSDTLDFLLTNCVVFTTNKMVYKQMEGLPMGGCISTALARIIMDDVMNHLFATIPKEHISFIKIFVDDTIAAIHPDYVTPTLNALNNYHNNIKFTIEYENELKSINFLNLTIIREKTVLTTNWYRKSFASGRLLNFYSSHKRTTIFNTAIAFIHTVLDLSDGRFFHANKEIVAKTLSDNSFPSDLITTMVNTYYTLFRGRPLPKIKNTSFKIYPQAITNSRNIKRIIHQLKFKGIVLADSSKNTKINLVRTSKAETPPERQTNAIIIAECVCKKRMKITSTSWNETAGMKTRSLLTSFKNCNGNTHAFTETSIHPGLRYQNQTNYLLKYIKWVNRDKLDADEIAFPNHNLIKLLIDPNNSNNNNNQRS